VLLGTPKPCLTQIPPQDLPSKRPATNGPLCRSAAVRSVRVPLAGGALGKRGALQTAGCSPPVTRRAQGAYSRLCFVDWRASYAAGIVGR
jgi:hypothetical protein